MRDIKFNINFIERDYGSVLVEFGKNKILCYATITDFLPPFLRGKKQGWLTAEYSMIPGSCEERAPREAVKGKQKARTLEIQRFIARSLRKALNTSRMNEKQIIIDCEVLSADGGTRVTAINGGYIALVLAVREAMKRGILSQNPIVSQIAGISIGMLNNKEIIDMTFEQDASADVDGNLVMNDKNEFVEMQISSEKGVFNEKNLLNMIDLGRSGIIEIMRKQSEVL
jgi:ribonuclease PH